MKELCIFLSFIKTYNNLSPFCSYTIRLHWSSLWETLNAMFEARTLLYMCGNVYTKNVK